MFGAVRLRVVLVFLQTRNPLRDSSYRGRRPQPKCRMRATCAHDAMEDSKNSWADSMATLRDITDAILRQEETLRLGGGVEGQARQRRHGRLPVRERLALLLDEERPFLECGLWAAHGMYAEWGEVPAAGIVTGIGFVSGRPCLIAANDATVKAGAMFPQSVKKLLRAQRIASRFCLPLIYLVDSAGVFLPRS